VLHPGPTLDYLASLEWIRAKENLCLAGRHGQSHVLVSLGIAAVHAGHKARYFTAADLAETFYSGLADNSVGKVIENLLRNDLILVDEIGFAPLDGTGAQLLFRLVSAAYERRSLGIGSHWPFDQWGRLLPEHTTAVSLLDRLLHHANVVVTDGGSYRMREARARGGKSTKHRDQPRGLGTFTWPPPGTTTTWPLTQNLLPAGRAWLADTSGVSGCL
jgi:DNA replication protein DnaC